MELDYIGLLFDGVNRKAIFYLFNIGWLLLGEHKLEHYQRNVYANKRIDFNVWMHFLWRCSHHIARSGSASVTCQTSRRQYRQNDKVRGNIKITMFYLKR